MQFRNIDRPKRPQAVTVEFSRVVKRDESSGPPDKMCDGFWPSLDPHAAGYIGDGKTGKDLASAKRAAQLRMNRWRGDAWQYVGVIARATIHCPIGGDSFTVYTIDSAGLWGIESDAGAYLDEVYAEELDGLRSQLATMGAAFLSLAPEREADVDTVRARLANPPNNVGQEVLDAFNRLFPDGDK